MKALSMIFMGGLSFILVACDAQDNVNRPKTEARTVIIGGVPTRDADYQLNTSDRVSTDSLESGNLAQSAK